jgi:hypothetical protein
MKRASLPLLRREFITLLGGALTSRPFSANAQPASRMRTVGVLMGLADDAEARARSILVPEPAFRRILEDIRDLQMAAQGASPTLVDAAALTRLARASSSSASRPMISAILLTLSSAGGSKSPHSILDR